MNIFRPSTVFFLALGMFLACATAQTVNQTEGQKRSQEIRKRFFEQQEEQYYQIARAYLNSGRFQLAIPILEDLLTRHPHKQAYYQTLFSAYLMINDLEKAENLIRRRLSQTPNDPALQIDQATLLLKKGDKEGALAKWQEVLDLHPSDITLYLRVANAMLQNRLFDEALQVYQTAIDRNPHAKNLYQNMAYLYQSRLMYHQAARYYLKYLEAFPTQQGFIFSRILSFELEPEERPAFFRTLDEVARNSKQKEKILLLEAQLHQRYREYDQALRLYRQLAENQKNDRYLLNFAKDAEKDSSYQVSLQAYQLIIDHPNRKQTTLLLEAYRGAVRTLFQLAEQSGEQKYANQALELIAAVQQQFPGAPELSYFSYQKGLFYLEYYFDVDRAAQTFQEIIRHPRVPPNLASQARLKLGECFIIKGDLPKAREVFQHVTNRKYKARALLNLAQIYFYQQEWKKAREQLQTLIGEFGVENETINNALELQMKITALENLPEVAAVFTEAELLTFQRKKSEALKKYDQLVTERSLPAALRSQIYLRCARLSLELEETPQALEYCRAAIQDSSLQNYADRALFLMASILENYLNRPEQAFEAYQQLLELYPNSLFAQASRDRMRIIRKNHPEILP